MTLVAAWADDGDAVVGLVIESGELRGCLGEIYSVLDETSEQRLDLIHLGPDQPRTEPVSTQALLVMSRRMVRGLQPAKSAACSMDAMRVGTFEVPAGLDMAGP